MAMTRTLERATTVHFHCLLDRIAPHVFQQRNPLVRTSVHTVGTAIAVLIHHKGYISLPTQLVDRFGYWWYKE